MKNFKIKINFGFKLTFCSSLLYANEFESRKLQKLQWYYEIVINMLPLLIYRKLIGMSGSFEIFMLDADYEILFGYCELFNIFRQKQQHTVRKPDIECQ